MLSGHVDKLWMENTMRSWFDDSKTKRTSEVRVSVHSVTTLQCIHCTKRNFIIRCAHGSQTKLNSRFIFFFPFFLSFWAFILTHIPAVRSVWGWLDGSSTKCNLSFSPIHYKLECYMFSHPSLSHSFVWQASEWREMAVFVAREREEERVRAILLEIRTI